MMGNNLRVNATMRVDNGVCHKSTSDQKKIYPMINDEVVFDEALVA